jgi:putative glutamine amidotransferase
MSMSKEQPLIGITGGLGAEWSATGTAHRSYAAAVENQGSRTVPLGHGRHGRFEECDGLFVSGGWDVNPKYMKPLPGDENLTLDEVTANYSIKTEKMRDEVEMRYIREALAQGKPYLGVCRGFQILNIVVGGYQIGDILTWMPDALTHRADEDKTSQSHEVTIEPGSILEKCYGSTNVTTNSRHHQGLTPEFVSEKFKITAMAPDGIVEAVEMKGVPFVVGVQWHPEKQSDEYINSISGPLFRAFVDACAAYRRSK